jgi:hypothetical protein
MRRLNFTYHSQELPLGGALDLFYAFHFDVHGWAQALASVSQDELFVLGGETFGRDDANHDAIERLLNNLAFANVLRPFEDMIQAPDGSSFGCPHVTLDAPHDAFHGGEGAATWTVAVARLGDVAAAVAKERKRFIEKCGADDFMFA